MNIFKIGDIIEFQCWQDKSKHWYQGVVEAFFDANEMKPLTVGSNTTTLAQSIDLDKVFSGPQADHGHCRSRFFRIRVQTGLWAEGYYYVLILRDHKPGSGDTDNIRQRGSQPCL